MRSVDLSFFDDGDNTRERAAVVFMDTSGSMYAVEVPNVAEDPQHYFAIRAGDAAAITRPVTDRIVGFAHTHTESDPQAPSDHDVSTMRDGLFGIVYHPSTRSTVWYDHHGIIHEDWNERA